jgi:transcriptional regulator with XRE-family HTH domain
MARLAANDPYDVSLGLSVRNARRAKGYSMEDIGQALGVSYQQIQKYETGASRISVKALSQIAAHLDMPIVELLPDHKKSKQETSRLYDEADEETVQLIKYWRRISVLRIRKFILAFVKEMLQAQTRAL